METKPITNADRIRAMTDEELAGIVQCPMFADCASGNCDPALPCRVCVLRWLRSPTESEGKE